MILQIIRIHCSMGLCYARECLLDWGISGSGWKRNDPIWLLTCPSHSSFIFFSISISVEGEERGTPGILMHCQNARIFLDCQSSFLFSFQCVYPFYNYQSHGLTPSLLLNATWNCDSGCLILFSYLSLCLYFTLSDVNTDVPMQA